MALTGGREQFGYPKKMAEEISLERIGEHVMGSVVRRGVEILHIEAELTGHVNPAVLDKIGPAATDLEGRPCRKVVSLIAPPPCEKRRGLVAGRWLPGLVERWARLPYDCPSHV